MLQPNLLISIAKSIETSINFLSVEFIFQIACRVKRAMFRSCLHSHEDIYKINFSTFAKRQSENRWENRMLYVEHILSDCFDFSSSTFDITDSKRPFEYCV